MARNSLGSRWMLAGLLVGASLGFMRGWPGVAFVGDGVAQVLAPLSAGARAVKERGRGLLAAPGDAAQLRDRIDSLERENAELKIANAKLGDVTRENERLRDLLEFKRGRVDLDLMGASVEATTFAREPGSLLHGIWVDVGREQGVAVDDPVASNRGLVGRVTRVLERSSQVRLISDAESSVGVRIERSQATGMLVGTPAGRLLMRYIPQNVTDQEPQAQVGDLVYTSGLSGAAHFPPMVPVGQIVEVLQSDERPTQDAVVRPFVSFADLQLVLVITDWRPEAGFGAAEPSGVPVGGDANEG
jgi:rod shape-determining protein MreC